MFKLPSISGSELIKLLEFIGFRVIRSKGSHRRLRAEDGRITTIPIHANKDVPKGLLRKIIRSDLEMSLKEFIDLYSKYKQL